MLSRSLALLPPPLPLSFTYTHRDTRVSVVFQRRSVFLQGAELWRTIVRVIITRGLSGRARFVGTYVPRRVYGGRRNGRVDAGFLRLIGDTAATLLLAQLAVLHLRVSRRYFNNCPLFTSRYANLGKG